LGKSHFECLVHELQLLLARARRVHVSGGGGDGDLKRRFDNLFTIKENERQAIKNRLPKAFGTSDGHGHSDYLQLGGLGRIREVVNEDQATFMRHTEGPANGTELKMMHNLAS